MDAPAAITCPECGDQAHRVTFPPDEGFEPGDIAAFVCSGCGSRFDVVLGEDDDVDTS